MSKPILAAAMVLQALSLCAQSTPTRDTVPSDSSSMTTLQEVTIEGRKPLVQIFPDKTIINVEASLSNAGATVLEVLERSPGITIDRNGNISIKSRQGVLVMIDGKPAQVSGNELTNLLSGMTAAQTDQIEIIDNPSSKYDAAGNAGIINIKTKKNRQKGFNGNINTTVSQGRYNRTVNSLGLNYYAGKINVFSNLTVNRMQGYTELYALRSYYDGDHGPLLSKLEQPSYFSSIVPSQTVKAGLDYFANAHTTLGFTGSGTLFNRRSTGNNTAIWMDTNGGIDSVITTHTNNRDRMHNGALNLNWRQQFGAGAELTTDIDFLRYRMNNTQQFSNRLQAGNGYVEMVEGLLPSAIDIFTAKSDYTRQWGNGVKGEAGWKSSRVNTNNGAEYFITDATSRNADLSKTNRFLYKETIHALYAGIEKKFERWNIGGGLRYENTSYDAHQLGNALRGDSAFSRRYDGLFPSFTASLHIDSSNTLGFSAGRRIDRPPFQDLNPFLFVINKYTYEGGNPFIIPQYTWNTELTHSYKDMIVTSFGYSNTRNYFSQIFLADTSGIITYTQGNLERMRNISLSVSTQLSPAPWWSLSAQAVVNHKSIRGYVWKALSASLTQASVNASNQFRFDRGWSGELSGYFTLSEQELQEIVDPTGQLAVGVAKQVWKGKGVVKLLGRDIFHSWAMKGFTIFEGSTEYFRIKRDTRSVGISFSYRFGGQAKTLTRNSGGADEEIRRVGASE